MSSLILFAFHGIKQTKFIPLLNVPDFLTYSTTPRTGKENELVNWLKVNLGLSKIYELIQGPIKSVNILPVGNFSGCIYSLQN